MSAALVARFTVPGIPQPGGSKKAFAYRGKDGRLRAAVTDDGKHNAPWRALVSLAAQSAMGGRGPADGSLKLVVEFVMPRPKAHFNSRGALKPDAPLFHDRKPDATKLLRALEDACTGIVWTDDARIGVQHVYKRYGAVAQANVHVESIG